MKVVVAPDKFAGTLSAAEAAASMADGWRRVRPSDDVVVVPMADGGEGTLEVVQAAVAGTERHHVDVADARGLAVRASWLLLPDGRALVEVAQAVGLSRLAPADRDPMQATSYGAGQLLRAAAAHGATQVVVGLGGSASVDGGAGAATALGARLRRADGNGVKVGARYLAEIAAVAPAPPLGVDVIAASDVRNPLLGPTGAVATFAPQKGARPDDLPVLETVLERFADVVERDVVGGPWRDVPGAGAAGGLGFALAAFTGATLTSGADAIAALVGLHAHLRGADVVVTGEGSLDAQTEQGKVPAYVAAAARQAGTRIFAVAGRISAGAERTFDAARDLGPDGMARAAALVAERTGELAATL